MGQCYNLIMKKFSIPFNKPSITNKEKKYVLQALYSNKLCGDGAFTKKVNNLFKEKFNVNNFLLTTSCSSALDMSAILLDLKKGDEVILPSYTFVSTANAVVLRGATPVFCDVEKDTMNINANLIEGLITSKTKAIYVVHYAGVVCDMDKIMAIAKKHNIYVVEDAAQAVGSYYKGKAAGTIGDMGCYSFHETKNYAMGEGGALIVNNPKFLERAEIIREKGTNRSQFLRGQIDKYTWQDAGSSFLPSEILAALLLAQLERFDEIMAKRLNIWHTYHTQLKKLEDKGLIELEKEPVNGSTLNAHMFYVLAKDIEERTQLISYLKSKNISTAFHYVPLHSAPFAKRILKEMPDLPVTDSYSARLLRLPMFADLTNKEVEYVINSIYEFYKENR